LIQSYIAFFTILYNSAHTKHTLKPADKGRRKATSTGHSSDQYYYILVTSTGSRADQYYSDRRPVLVTPPPRKGAYTRTLHRVLFFSAKKLLQRLPIYTTPSSGCVLSEA